MTGMRRLYGVAVSGAAALAVCALPDAAAAATGKVKVTVSTPAGVPANVVLRGGGRHVVAKAPSGKRRATTLTLKARRYVVVAGDVAFNGRTYIARASKRSVRVAKRKTARVKVTYRLARSAAKLRATKIAPTALTLSWSAPKGARRFALRRAAGPDAPTGRGRGSAVRVRGRRGVDVKLTPGTQYSYALFTKVGRKWVGPLTLSAGTAPPAGSTAAAFVSSPGTLLAEAGDVAAASATGTGVAVRLTGKDGPPTIGAVVVLPQSATLPGGFLGRVTAIGEDGTATLTPAGLSDAFDYYDLDIPSFSSPEEPLVPAAGATGGRSLRRAAAAPACLGGSGAQSIELKPSIGLGGHFKAKLDTYKIFGKEVPTGASMDMEFTVTATNAMSAKWSLALKCVAPFKGLMKTLTTSPVPISMYLVPVAEAFVSGEGEISNIGVKATGGIQFKGSLGLKGADLSGGPILKASMLEPKGVLKGKIGGTLGGEVIIGPGAGTTGAGVIAGVGGKLNPIDASFGPVFAADDSRFGACLEGEAAFTRELNLTAKAWLGSWDISRSITYDWLKGRSDYFGDTWHWPNDCTKLPKDEPAPEPTPQPEEPGDSVLGEGVEMVDDETTGAPEQWGYLDGFVPGGTAWVLSTGNIETAKGTPDTFSSTDMGMPGDADLSAFAGHATYDAAAYTVKLVPKGSTLHVSYVFASEEYPEYVDSTYNDVMEILVDGVNCATVPGTSAPVSVNTVNMHTNSEHYVDNSTGAAGYSTTMDGLTVPLTCNAPVTPGQEVTVKIAVADSSDAIYDSAVALVDKGIWSD